jgi:multidrug resistance efflux pump
MSKTTTFITIMSLLLGVGAFAVFATATTDSVVVTESVSEPEVRLSKATLPIAVAGTVTAANTATVYSKTSGVLTALPYREGATVSNGAVLALQDTPVARAQQTLAQAEGDLATVERTVQRIQAETNQQLTEVQASSAATIATLRAGSNAERIAETTARTAAAVQSEVATLLEVMDYLNNNRSLLSSTGSDRYNDALRLTYGNRATSFDAGWLFGSAVEHDMTLRALSAEADTSLDAAQQALRATIEVLSLLNEALATAEREVFDSDAALTEEKTAQYLQERTRVTTALVNLEMLQSEIQQVIDTTTEDSVGQDQSVAVRTIDREAAARQAALAEAATQQTQRVNDAVVGVSAAELSLGQVTAPFAGVVSTVFVNEGEYLVPGTPLLELVGAGARELTVTIPNALVSALAVGQDFVVDGAVVGTVDRFSSSANGLGHTVIITLASDVSTVGATLRGHIMVTLPADSYVVPREYLHFTSAGPSIVYQSGTRAPVRIIYDTGSDVFVTTAVVVDAPLVSALYPAL